MSVALRHELDEDFSDAGDAEPAGCSPSREPPAPVLDSSPEPRPRPKSSPDFCRPSSHQLPESSTGPETDEMEPPSPSSPEPRSLVRLPSTLSHSPAAHERPLIEPSASDVGARDDEDAAVASEAPLASRPPPTLPGSSTVASVRVVMSVALLGRVGRAAPDCVESIECLSRDPWRELWLCRDEEDEPWRDETLRNDELWLMRLLPECDCEDEEDAEDDEPR